jgi:hypothetical protein
MGAKGGHQHSGGDNAGENDKADRRGDHARPEADLLKPGIHGRAETRSSRPNTPNTLGTTDIHSHGRYR